MRSFLLLLAIAAVSSPALAASPAPVLTPIPLPPPRPAAAEAAPANAAPSAPSVASIPTDPFAALGIDPDTVTSAPTSCDQRLARIADVNLMPRLVGPGACGGHDLLRLSAVVLPDKSRVSIHPAALLNCPMAESLAAWLRDAVAPALAKRGARLAGLVNYDSYQCRTRDSLPGAKISEHAHGDAIDVRAFLLADGRRMSLVDRNVDEPLRVGFRDSACHRFTTVLGPGERFHSGHIHLDDIARHNGYRICHWDVLGPAPTPLPPPRPAVVAGTAPARIEASRQHPAGPKEDKAAADSKPNMSTDARAREPVAAGSARPDNTIEAVVAGGKGAHGTAAATIVQIEPRPATIAPQPAVATADIEADAIVPLPAPRPAHLVSYDAHRSTHTRHRKQRHYYFHFPFILWR